ncbi:MAG: hypothetical protein ACKVI4_16530 [Actinomycetales bacterium]
MGATAVAASRASPCEAERSVVVAAKRAGVGMPSVSAGVAGLAPVAPPRAAMWKASLREAGQSVAAAATRVSVGMPGSSGGGAVGATASTSVEGLALRGRVVGRRRRRTRGASACQWLGVEAVSL